MDLHYKSYHLTMMYMSVAVFVKIQDLIIMCLSCLSVKKDYIQVYDYFTFLLNKNCVILCLASFLDKCVLPRYFKNQISCVIFIHKYYLTPSLIHSH